MNPDGFSKKVSVMPAKIVIRHYTAVMMVNEIWCVYEGEKLLLLNLKEFQAKSIAAILNVQ